MRKLVIPVLLVGLLLSVSLLPVKRSGKPANGSKAAPSKRNVFPSQVKTPDLRLVLPPPVRRKVVTSSLPHPFVLPLQQRERFYQRRFAAAQKSKQGAWETKFLRVLERERHLEATRKGFSQQTLRLEAMRYLRYRSLKRYRLFGYRVLARCERLLDDYLSRGGSPLEIPNDSRPGTFPLAQKLTRLAGFYPLLLGQIGVTEAKKGQRLSPTQRYWFRTLMMARWARQVWGYRPLEFLMEKTVYGDYLRARIIWTRKEDSRILAYRELIRLVPDFPKYRVLGWLLLSMGKKEKARFILKKALKKSPQDPLSRSLLQRANP